jgi:ADP-heptose:LPS heptosyltransferase
VKILVLRFSSIGDIVLTTPVVRCLRKKFPDAYIAYATKQAFGEVVASNPYINKVYTFTGEPREILQDLKNEKFDVIVDLHKNIRSTRLKKSLGIKAYSFPKLNFKKWLLVNLHINRMPEIHIVDRYFKAVEKLGVKNDGQGLDYFIPTDTKHVDQLIPPTHRNGFVVLVLGAAHATKAIPQNKLELICKNIQYPVVLIGGKNEKELGNRVVGNVGAYVYNTAGALSLNESAQLIKHSKLVVTPDTGMMHIAAALQKPIISVWGNTVPEFGMYPYLPQGDKQHVVFENRNLRCRPCSKIGYDKCPKGHFKCMMDLDYEKLSGVVKQSL